MYQGSCLCKKVAIQIDGLIDSIIHCHCSLCRKSSGTAFATNGFVNRVDFKVIKGLDSLTAFEFKPGRIRHFCTACGSPVYSENLDDRARLRLRLGILDSDINERPLSHNFCSSKANWEDFDVKLPHYNGFEPSR
ncbi:MULTISPECIES: GFA family protein [unclassified Pseudoalteromonas]|uniref:GFA family protein n=1 Tax=unclassified Pseudoalteromonas TaxID=194690 RepID=UPI000B3C346B|nr:MULTISPECIES: GFA family protein [unclassified Pseudoalteromonas]MDN3379760.1 GFA family protein [Pseudoalteromonas sp. APC 3893]MDN3388114.1 GFA family protein [Pseudoalteromonas sp. APC 4017]OUS70348.1 aldehyde-activating protein [Pseudoalteromonas sp. A601]